MMTFLNPLNNDFFGVCIPLAYYFGMLPDILESKSTTFKVCYKIYTGLIYSLALFFHASQLFKLYQLLVDDTVIFDEIIRNSVITSMHFTALVKCLFLRGKLSGNIFKTVMAYEAKIYRGQDKEVFSVYDRTLSSVSNTKNYYLAGIIVVVAFYIAAPALRDPYYIQKGNETITIEQLPLSCWTPVDDNYWLAFAWTSAAGAYLTVFFVTTDITCYSFIMFGICQIEILHYSVANFHEHAGRLRDAVGCSEEESFRRLQKRYVMMHQEIISYIKNLNGSLKNIMVLDFVPSSVQVAGMLFQMMTNLSVIQCILLGEFICTLIARIFIYCNSAHNLVVKSQSVATAWYEMDWIDLPRDVRTNIVICVMRAQKPLHIGIGDFQAISLNTFLAILKGTYSYMMLLTTM